MMLSLKNNTNAERSKFRPILLLQAPTKAEKLLEWLCHTGMLAISSLNFVYNKSQDSSTYRDVAAREGLVLRVLHPPVLSGLDHALAAGHGFADGA